MAIRVQAGKRVTVAYRLIDKDGHLLEEKTPEHPYEYIQGQGQIVAAIERAVEGKTAGFQTELVITPRDGYGEYNSSLVAEVPRSQLPAEVEIEVGMKFNTTNTLGEPVVVRVIEINGPVITVDGNHPLAGLDLTFEIRLLDVQDEGGDEDEGGDGKEQREHREHHIEVKLRRKNMSDVH